MLHIFRQIKDQQSYENRLAEYAKPFKPMLEDANAYWEKYQNFSEKFRKQPSSYIQNVDQFFYWHSYALYMIAEVIFPTIRTVFAILERQSFIFLFENAEELEGLSPVTYSEAYEFFHNNEIDDSKAILRRWTNGIDFVTLIDALETNNRDEFICIFKTIDDVVRKLRSIRIAMSYFPLMKVMLFLCTKLENLDFTPNKQLDELDATIDILEKKDWESFDEFCDNIGQFLIPIFSENDFETFRANSYWKNLYENVFVQLLQVKDCSNLSHVDQAISYYERNGSSKEFYRFWKDLADIAFGILTIFHQSIFHSPITAAEKRILGSIVVNEDNHIPSLHLNAIIRLFTSIFKKDDGIDVKNMPLLRNKQSKYEKFVLQGKPYFDEAMQRGIIAENGNHLIWFGPQILLAYFCGRIYCGDKPELILDQNVDPTWIPGKGRFPDKFVCELFEVQNIGQQRKNQKNGAVPPEYTIVDEIFDTISRKVTKSNTLSNI